MDEHGPPPMKEFKPVQTNPTAADKFWRDHQEQYENLVEPAGQIQRVERHNDAFPKLKDELDKKRTAKTTRTTNMRRHNNTANRTVEFYNPKCKRCMRDLKELEARKNKKAASRKKSFEKRSRVTKTYKNKTLNRGNTIQIRECNAHPPKKREIAIGQNNILFKMASNNPDSVAVRAKGNSNMDSKETNVLFSSPNYDSKGTISVTSSKNNVNDNNSTRSVNITKSVHINDSTKNENESTISVINTLGA